MIAPWMAALGTGGISLAVYLRTMCRTIYVGDSGELAAAVHVAGMPHPPGYPLYVLLGKFFSLLAPVGKPALRINLFSAVCSSASVVLLYLTFNELKFEAWLCAGLALCWAFSASLWSQSGIARVYALGACISSLTTFFFVKWYAHPDQTYWLIWSCFVIGLGLANHPVVGGHLPAILAAAALAHPELLKDRALLLWMGLALLPGISLYFTWIPLRARMNPPVNWGNIRTPIDLWRFLSRKQYWKHRWVSGPTDLWQVIVFYIRRVGIEYGFLGAAAIVVGTPLLIAQARPIAAMAGLLVFLNAFSMIAHARREDIYHWTRYMITAWFGLIFPLAIGWRFTLEGFPEPARPYVAFLPAFLLLVMQFRKQDLSRHHYADDYNRRILENLPENATLIAQDDNVVFPLMYLKYAEGLRPDVRLLEQGVHQLAELRFNPRRDAVYCTHWQGAFNSPATARGPGLRLVAEGLIYRIVATDMAFTPRHLWEHHLLPDMEDPLIPRNYLTRCLLGHVYFMRGEWEAAIAPVTAAAWYDRAARMAWDSPVLNYNLGLTYARYGWKLLSDDAFARAEKLDRSYSRSSRLKQGPQPEREPAP